MTFCLMITLRDTSHAAAVVDSSDFDQEEVLTTQNTTNYWNNGIKNTIPELIEPWIDKANMGFIQALITVLPLVS